MSDTSPFPLTGVPKILSAWACVYVTVPTVTAVTGHALAWFFQYPCVYVQPAGGGGGGGGGVKMLVKVSCTPTSLATSTAEMVRAARLTVGGAGVIGRFAP